MTVYIKPYRATNHSLRIMKIAFIHNDPRYVSGTNYINKLIEKKMIEKGIETAAVYPDPDIFFRGFPADLSGLVEVLVFFSTCRDKNKVIECDAVYGTTYSAIAYLGYSKKIISHFGSTMQGVITALAVDHDCSSDWVWREMKGAQAIDAVEFNPTKDRFLNDIARLEAYVARNAATVIAVSKKVKDELIDQRVPEDKIKIVHNGVEDFWFESDQAYDHVLGNFGVCALGRIGGRIKDLKIKGVDRLAAVYENIGDIEKTSILLSRNERACQWMEKRFKNHTLHRNLSKEGVKEIVSKLRGHALLITSRYEGFSLPMVEGMSQGLIPVSFKVGVAPEIIKNGENGFIVGSVKDMIAKIKQLAGDKNKRVKMAEAAAETARKFSADSMANKVADIIRSI